MFRARPRGRRSVSRAPQRWRRRTVSGARPRRRWRTVFGTPVMMRRRRQRRDAGTAPSDRNAPPAIGLCQHDIDIAPIPARFLIPVVRRPVLRVSVTANGVVKNIRSSKEHPHRKNCGRRPAPPPPKSSRRRGKRNKAYSVDSPATRCRRKSSRNNTSRPKALGAPRGTDCSCLPNAPPSNAVEP